MGTYAHRREIERGAVRWPLVSPHLIWLAAGLVLAFLVPYVLADVLALERDVFYGIYMAFAFGLFLSWARTTGRSLVALLRRRWLAAVSLGAAFAAVMAFVVLRTEDATARPDGLELAAAVLWRGVLYGLADGVLLSAFPILAVFAAFAASPLRERLAGKALIGFVALLASAAMTAAYHSGYSDFRSDKLRSPIAGDVVWSAPTLLTLNPVGAPIAHAGLHVTAVLHSYETDLFLPPHD